MSVGAWSLEYCEKAVESVESGGGELVKARAGRISLPYSKSSGRRGRRREKERERERERERGVATLGPELVRPSSGRLEHLSRGFARYYTHKLHIYIYKHIYIYIYYIYKTYKTQLHSHMYIHIYIATIHRHDKTITCIYKKKFVYIISYVLLD